MAAHLAEIIVELSNLDLHLVEDGQVCLTLNCGPLNKDGLHYSTNPLIEEIQTTWPSIFACLQFIQQILFDFLFLSLSLNGIFVSAGISLEVLIEERIFYNGFELSIFF